MKRIVGISFLALVCSTLTVHAVVYNLVGPADPMTAGGRVSLDLVMLNPGAAEAVLSVPEILMAKLSNGSQEWPVNLRAAEVRESIAIKAGGFEVQKFIFELPENARDRLVLAIETPTVARVALEVSAQRSDTVVRPPRPTFAPPQTAEEAVKRVFAGRFGAHEPIYFIYGNERQAAKFQFSFKYRILGADAALGEHVPALRRLYFGYTQRSLWDIDEESSPFYDTSYLPELMFESQKVLDPDSPGGFKWMGYQAGLRHESNGRADFNSRSLNIVYFRPGVAIGRFDSWHLILAPRFWHYISDLSNNPDIEDYRGNLEFQAILGHGDSATLALTSRLGREKGKGSVQADLNIPVKFDRVFDFATYVLIQYWHGYGESLLDYNTKSSAVRIGFSLVR